MRRILIAFLVAATAGLFMWAAATASADPGGAGTSTCPPSTHEAPVGSGTCVPNGDGGGNCGQNQGGEPGDDNGFGNGDACGTTTTTAVTVTTTVPPTEAPTTTVTEPTTTEATATSTTTQAPPKQHSQPPTTEGGQKGTPSTPEKLAYTGVENVVPIGAAVVFLAALGTGLMWLGRKRNVA